MTLTSFSRTFSIVAALALVFVSWTGVLTVPAQAASIAVEATGA